MSHTRKHIAAALKAGQSVECYATGVIAAPDARHGFSVTRKGSQWATTYKRATDAAACAAEMIARHMRGGSGF